MALPDLPALPPFLGLAATEALVEEASLRGKPGLVGPEGRGAHEDMDLGLMLASAQALRPWFEECATLALGFKGGDSRLLFSSLRAPGIRAEKAMFAATGGVNTHKGAVFTLGLLSAAAVLASRDAGAGRPLSGEAVLARAAEMAQGLGAELAAGEGSAGLRLHRELGVRGLRGEAEDGYPVLAARVLPALRLARGRGAAAREEALIEALLGAMCDLEDSCVISRGGLAGLGFVKAGAALVLSLPSGWERKKALAALGAELTARRLSPGGSADLLSAGIFLDRLEEASCR